MFSGFKEFILRGNVIDLALFNAASLEKALPVTIPTTAGDTATMYFGAVIAALIQFVLVAIVVYFALILPINYLKRLSFRRKEEGKLEDTPAPPTELELLAEIRDLLAKRDPSGIRLPANGPHTGH